MGFEKKYSIKAVSKISGLTEFVIRAWEKRYNAVEPSRTETNRRVYSEEDIQKLKLLREATQNGHSIGNIADLSIDALKDLVGSRTINNKIITPPLNNNIVYSDHLEICLNAIKNLNGEELERELLKASVNLSQPALFEKLLIPLLEEIGKNWQEGGYRVVNEHMASTIIGNFLSNSRENFKISNSAPKILFATPMGQHHEFGALLAASVAASAGWKATYLGPNLPMVDLINAAEKLQAKAVALSLIYPPDDLQLKNELEKLKILGKNISVIAGGRVANTYLDILNELNAHLVKDFNEFRNVLDLLITEKK
jgi:DNA-binding transcriptional MerR regulator/methylmalonyl-CoA mutase cobalamin-binding subunit